MMLYSRQEAVLTAVLLAAGLLPMNANAYVSFSKNGEELINTLHTHIYSPTLSLPSSKEIKVAKVCFITDVSDCSGNEFSSSEDLDNPSGGGIPDYDLNDAERCKYEGYTISGCPDGFTPSGKCPYGDYYRECVGDCPSNYVTCEPPYYGVGEACGNKYASCEEDTERACKELNPNYTNNCSNGAQINPNDKCKYDESFGLCCDSCSGYDYTTIPEGYVQDGEACTDCNGQTRYKVKVNPCDGFMDCGSVGPQTGAASCQSGSVTKYDNCKACPNLGTLTSCPSPFTCAYEECSNLYYKTGCQSGYTWNETTQTCTAQCDSSYKYTCDSGNYVTGGSGTACDGKYQSCNCQSEYDWNGSSCRYCDPSYYKYTCSGTGYAGGWGDSCFGKYSRCSCLSGYEWKDSACVACDSSYKYSCYKTGFIYGGLGESCSGKYKECECSNGRIFDIERGNCEECSFTLSSCPEHAHCVKGMNEYCFQYCDSGYTYSEENGKCNRNCKVGDIYYSDGTCSDSDTIESGKSPLGTILYINKQENRKNYKKEIHIMSMETAGKAQWGPVGFKTPVGTCYSCVENAINNISVGYGLGTDCTSCYLSQGGSLEDFPSIKLAVNYAPSGAPKTKGHWEFADGMDSRDVDYWLSIGYGADYSEAWRKKKNGHLERTKRTESYDIFPVLKFYTLVGPSCGGYCPIDGYYYTF